MNNSDNNDFEQWQGGDFDENNPNNYLPSNFPFHMHWKYYGPNSPKFRKMWEDMNKGDGLEELANYLNLNDIFKQNMENEMNKKQNARRSAKKNSTVVNFTQDEYMKLIEIRGYLAITEQYAHVKALDKVLNQIKMVPYPPKQKD